MSSATIRNWDRTQSFRPKAIHHPADEEDVARLIARAAERGRRVKPLGGALSWSDAIDVPQEAMLFDRMTGIDVDTGGRTVRVQAGARLADVNATLSRSGLALDNFGSITMQTAAGYLGTGSHGTGGRTPMLAAAVRRLRLVDGRAGIHDLDAGHEGDLFAAARVHLGCLGAVTEVTIACVDAFSLEARLTLVPFDTVLSDLEGLVARNDYLKLWWLPYTDRVQVYAFNRTDRPPTRPNLAERLDRAGASCIAFGALMAFCRACPPATRGILPALQALHFRPHVRVDRSDRVIPYAGAIPRHQEAEYAIPREHAAAAIDALRRRVLTARYRVNFPMEVRFVAADDIPMSPTCGRDSCYVGAYVGSRTWAEPYCADLESIVAGYGGRPHWGKMFHRSAAELRALYPGYDAFDALRRRLDPQGVFRNRFTDRVFQRDGPNSGPR